MEGSALRYSACLINICVFSRLIGFSMGDEGRIKSQRPNFLILISDDQRWDQVSYAGNQIIPELRTPNLDRLASEGVCFSNAFATTPICAVSRASILTGRYASSHGMNHFNTPLQKDVMDNTYPALLKRAGYRTGVLGKWGMEMAGAKIPPVIDGKSLLPVMSNPEVEEMYNLMTDPMEMENLIDDKDFINVKKDLKKRFDNHLNRLSGKSLADQKVKKSSDKIPVDRIISLWDFDHDIPGFAIDNHQKKQDSLFGRYEYVPGAKGKAIKLDGFRTYLKRSAMNQQPLTDGFSIEAWIAPATYPWSWCPVFDCTDENRRGFEFGIDNIGRVGFGISAGSSWFLQQSELTIPLREWTHIAAVYQPNDRIKIFINGEEAATLDIEGAYIPSGNGHPFATIGRNNHSVEWKEYQLTTPDSYFYLDGLLDEIRIFSGVRDEREIRDYITSLGKLPIPALSKRGNFPTGPVGSGTFGAYYTKLDYYKEWDDMWRVSDKSDVFVRFDNSPVQLIFWRGTSYVPCWVSENDIWYTNEWLETWGRDVVSCAEPIMDNQCRYSHVRIIENNDARVVVHWRYALADAFYTIAAITDDGRGEWCDEYHIIYPDHVGVRRMELHYSKPERKHDWVEQIVLTPPGVYPDDIIDSACISLVNMQGEVMNYSWHGDIQIEMPEPRGANISLVNLKSEYRPFFIVSPDSVNTVEGKWESPFFRTYAANMATNAYRPDSVPSVFGWWNHWPVAQIPGDGRWVLTPDKPGHFNLTTFVQWNDLIKSEKTRTRIMLQGMTRGNAQGLVRMAESWLNAPEMAISSEGFGQGIYDPAERAYMIEKITKKGIPLELLIMGAEGSPIFNPAIVVKNWNQGKASVYIDGKENTDPDRVRQGIRPTPFGNDLILWLKVSTTNRLNITLK